MSQTLIILTILNYCVKDNPIASVGLYKAAMEITSLRPSVFKDTLGIECTRDELDEVHKHFAKCYTLATGERRIAQRTQSNQVIQIMEPNRNPNRNPNARNYV